MRADDLRFAALACLKAAHDFCSSQSCTVPMHKSLSCALWRQASVGGSAVRAGGKARATWRCKGPARSTKECRDLEDALALVAGAWSGHYQLEQQLLPQRSQKPRSALHAALSLASLATLARPPKPVGSASPQPCGHQCGQQIPSSMRKGDEPRTQSREKERSTERERELTRRGGAAELSLVIALCCVFLREDPAPPEEEAELEAWDGPGGHGNGDGGHGFAPWGRDLGKRSGSSESPAERERREREEPASRRELIIRTPLSGRSAPRYDDVGLAEQRFEDELPGAHDHAQCHYSSPRPLPRKMGIRSSQLPQLPLLLES